MNTCLAGAKTFFESLQPFNSPGKMKNLALSVGYIDTYKSIPDILGILDSLEIFAQKNSQLIVWIKQAITALAPANLWVIKIEEAEEALDKMLTDGTAALLNNLNDTWVKQNMELLRSGDKAFLLSFGQR
jgi:hypothetical protein